MPDSTPPVRILFVCMGNICRSPTAHAVFLRRLEQAGIRDRVEVDSAGTHGYHVGSAPDSRAIQAAAGRGYDLTALRARRVEAADLVTFDYVIAMDRANLDILRGLAGESTRAELALLLDYVPGHEGADVPDPYYGARNGFDEVLDLVEAGADALMARLHERHGLQGTSV